MKIFLILTILTITACGTEEDFVHETRTQEVTEEESEEQSYIREGYTEVCDVYQKGENYVVTRVIEVQESLAPQYTAEGMIACEGLYDENGIIPIPEQGDSDTEGTKETWSQEDEES